MQTRQRQPHERRGVRELAGDQLDQVSGGMKWVRGHKSPNVIDARGGQGSFGIFTWTYDIDGNVSSFGIR